MSSTRLLSICSIAVICAATPQALAESHSIDWFTVDGGGAISTGGVYSITGTIGQPAPGGSMSGDNFALTGGFWSLLSALQTPGAPLLVITLTGTNTFVVSWLSVPTGFDLQQNINLTSTTWTTPSETVIDNGTNKFIVVTPPTGNRFYRLSKP